jgi:hypothetical protein
MAVLPRSALTVETVAKLSGSDAPPTPSRRMTKVV